MSVVSIDKAGRVIIPAEVRKKLGIATNTRLFLIDIGDKIVIEKWERLEIAKRLQEELKSVDIDKIVSEKEGEMNNRVKKLGSASEGQVNLSRNQPALRIDRVRAVVAPILREFGVTRASIFGSAIRDDFSEESDIDMLVKLPKGSTLLDLVKLEDELKEKLGRKVDLVTIDAIHPLLKQTILAEQVAIYP